MHLFYPEIFLSQLTNMKGALINLSLQAEQQRLIMQKGGDIV